MFCPKMDLKDAIGLHSGIYGRSVFMVIQAGAYNMASRREFVSKHTITQRMESGVPEYEAEVDEVVSLSGKAGDSSAEGEPLKGNFLSTLAYTKYGRLSDDLEGIGNGGKEIAALRAGRMTDLERVGAIEKGISDDFEDMNYSMQFQTLNHLFRIFFGKQDKVNWQDMLWGSQASGGYQTMNIKESYEESEMTSFSTQGVVQTADGRELSFDLHVGMSRSFYQETNLSFLQQNRVMLDPIVVHLEQDVDAVSDQTFYFDLDADGAEEEIASLKAGSAFLALDKNEDGKINDGSELFGAMTGDGFSELAQYDLDGNGWIDEADEIFDKLKVWSLDKDGNPQMFSLKESDIGAICLASAPTQFSVTDELNEARAMVRRTGFFLRESTGTAGAVQQIDLAAV